MVMTWIFTRVAVSSHASDGDAPVASSGRGGSGRVGMTARKGNRRRRDPPMLACWATFVYTKWKADGGVGGRRASYPRDRRQSGSPRRDRRPPRGRGVRRRDGSERPRRAGAHGGAAP